MSTAVIEAVSTKRRERQEHARAAYGEAVILLTDGKELTPEHLDGILDAAGKTPAELGQAVQLAKQRREWAAAIAAADKAAEDEPALREQIQALGREESKRIRAVQLEYDQKSKPVWAKIQAIKALNVQAEEARDELRRTCDRTQPALEESYRQYEALAPKLAAAAGAKRNAIERLQALKADEREAEKKSMHAKCTTEERAKLRAIIAPQLAEADAELSRLLAAENALLAERRRITESASLIP